MGGRHTWMSRGERSPRSSAAWLKCLPTIAGYRRGEYFSIRKRQPASGTRASGCASFLLIDCWSASDALSRARVTK